MGFGPTTSTLARLRSTPELYPHHQRTRYSIPYKKINCKNFFYIFSKKIYKLIKGVDKTRYYWDFRFYFFMIWHNHFKESYHVSV